MSKRYTDRDLAILRNKMGENIPVPKERKKRSNEESQIQQAVIRWWALSCHAFGFPETLLFSIPNGGWRDPVGSVILKREGQRNGVCDLFLAIPRRGMPGMFIEMKRPGGVVSKEQKEFLSAVSAQGYDARICYSFDQAVATITNYLTVT